MPDRYIPLGGRRVAVTIVFVALVLVFAAELVADIRNIRFLDRVPFVDTLSAVNRAAHDGVPGVLATLEIAAYVSAAIVFIVWLEAAYRNVDVVDAAERRYGHGWAIGAWFVPVLNLWRPTQIVNDVWRASTSEAPGGLLLAWWAAFLLSGWGAPVRTETSDLHAAAVRSAIGDGFALIAAALAIAVVWRITSSLDARAARRAEPLPGGWQAPPQPA